MCRRSVARQPKAFCRLGAELTQAAGAGDRNRTRNLLFTKQLLCQLSYAGKASNCPKSGVARNRGNLKRGPDTVSPPTIF